MIYDFIKATLDGLGYENAQDTPFSQTHDFDGMLFVYTASNEAITDYTIGGRIMDFNQEFKIYGITSDQFVENSLNDGMGKRLFQIFGQMKASLPQTVVDSNGNHLIVDVINPSIQYEGTDNKQLRVTSLTFDVLWTYRFGD